MTDKAEESHRYVYDGRSGRANAPENQNPEFQAGFRVGTGHAHLNRITLHGVCGDEWERRGNPIDDLNFAEWQRGVHAAWLQGQPT